MALASNGKMDSCARQQEERCANLSVLRNNYVFLRAQHKRVIFFDFTMGNHATLVLHYTFCEYARCPVLTLW